jgi:hypothetical protein
MSNYVVGHNMPGYLPESEPWITADWESARNSLIFDLEKHADNLADILDDGDDLTDGPLAAINSIDAMIADLRALTPGSEWGDSVDNTAYWLSLTDEEVSGDE